MSNEDNLAHEMEGRLAEPASSGGSTAGSEARRAPRDMKDYNFETPDEESMQFLEEQWQRFCRSIGLEGDIPDVRAALAAERTALPVRPVPVPLLVRPFAAVRRWLRGFPGWDAEREEA